MKTIIDTEKPALDNLEFVFDERDEAFTEEDREIIKAAHEAGLASCRALDALRDKYPDASADARLYAPQIFAQAVGASLGIMFGETVRELLPQVLLCARVTTMTQEERDKVNDEMKESAAKIRAGMN